MKRYLFTEDELRLRWAEIQAKREKTIKNNINNINYNYNNNQDLHEEQPTTTNIKVNNINRARNFYGLRATINSDPDFVHALDEWAVGEPFLYAAVRDHGEYAIKGIISRVRQLRDGYFNVGKYGPIHQQRGRLLNHEIQKLRRQRA